MNPRPLGYEPNELPDCSTPRHLRKPHRSTSIAQTATSANRENTANAARREALQARVAAADAPPPLLHPEMAGLYRQKVTALAEALEHPETRTEASEALRGLIDAIVVTPNQGELQIELKGNLAAMLGAAQNAKRSPETGDLSLQVVMVAGAGFEPATFGL